MKYLAFLIALMAALTCGARNIEEWNKELIDTVATEIADFDNILQRRTAAIDSVAAVRNACPLSATRVQMGAELGRRYLAINADSALMYFQLALKDANMLGDDDLAMSIELNTLSTLPRTGVDIEALEAFRAIDPTRLSDTLRHVYWTNAAVLYNNLYVAYPRGQYRTRYKELVVEALDSLSTFYPVGSPVAAFIEAQQHRFSGQDNLATAILVEHLSGLECKPELYEVSLKHIAEYYENRPQYKAVYLNYLLRLCLHELRQDIIRPEVLASLGTALHEEGFDQSARRLITAATKTGTTSYRSTNDFDRAAYANYLADSNSRSYIIANIIIAVLVLAVILLLWYILKLRKRLKALDRSLDDCDLRIEKATDDIKKVAALVLSMAVKSDEQLKEYNLHLLRKIKAGQMKELAHDVQSGEYLRQLNEKFFSAFDESFLTAFPRFVDHLNALVRPDKQLSLLPGQRLSPELRIAAFMRLGISDSGKLSSILDLSVNTIYTYRNRLKGRAKDKADFEKKISEIQLGI